jgi:hypothetical protein
MTHRLMCVNKWSRNESHTHAHTHTHTNYHIGVNFRNLLDSEPNAKEDGWQYILNMTRLKRNP